MINYIGPDHGQGVRIYLDGVRTERDDIGTAGSFSFGDGRIVVGRFYPYQTGYHTSVDVDELLFFNQKLNDQQIMDIKHLG